MNNNPSIPGYARVLLIIIPYFIIVGVFQYIGMLVTQVDFKNFDISAISSQQHLIISLFDLLSNFLLLSIFVNYVDKENLISVGLDIKKRLKDIVMGLALGLGIMGIGLLSLLFFDEIDMETVNFSYKEIFMMFFLFMIVSIVEEVLLRGYVLRNLMYSFNNYLALIISSLLFATLHLGNPNMDWFNFMNLFLAGILLGASYIFTKNLWFPIALHFSWNFFQSLFGFNVSGIDSYSLIEFKIKDPNLWNGGAFGFEGSFLSVIAQVIVIILIFYYYKNPLKLNSSE